MKQATPELVAELRAQQQDAFGHVRLADVIVDVSYPDLETGETKSGMVELQIEPEVVMQGHEFFPGVTFRPEYHALDRFDPPLAFGEVIAFAINEGRLIADSIDGIAFWRVTDDGITALREWGVI